MRSLRLDDRSSHMTNTNKRPSSEKVKTTHDGTDHWLSLSPRSKCHLIGNYWFLEWPFVTLQPIWVMARNPYHRSWLTDSISSCDNRGNRFLYLFIYLESLSGYTSFVCFSILVNVQSRFTRNIGKFQLCCIIIVIYKYLVKLWYRSLLLFNNEKVLADEVHSSQYQV